MSSFEPILIFDGHNLLCRSAFSFQSLQTSDGRFLGGLYGFVKTLLRVAGFYQGTYRPIVCWDKGRSSRRLETAPDYKDRPRMDLFCEPIPKQVEWAQELCTALGVTSIQLDGVEADDIIAVLSRMSRRSVIYSTDKDFFQLVREGHTLRRPGKTGEVVYDWETREHYTGLKARLYLALMGDKVDNIPGVPGVGETTAKNILEALEVHPTLDFKEALKPGREPVELKLLVQEALQEKRKKIRNWKNVTAHWDQFLKSLALVDLWRKDLLTQEQLVQVLAKLKQTIEPDWDHAQRLFNAWEFSFTSLECKSMLLGESINLDALWDDDEEEEDSEVEDSLEDIVDAVVEPVASAEESSAEGDVDALLSDLLDLEEPAEEPLLDALDEDPESEPLVEGPKVQWLCLGMGYAEEAYLSVLNVRHCTGFFSVEEALENFGKVLLGILSQQQRRKNDMAQVCPHCKELIVQENPEPDVYQLIALFQNLYLATNDSVARYWDLFEEAGWDLSPAWNREALQNAVFVPECAERLVGVAVFPNAPPDEWFSWDSIEAPPDIKIRKAH